MEGGVISTLLCSDAEPGEEEKLQQDVIVVTAAVTVDANTANTVHLPTIASMYQWITLGL